MVICRWEWFGFQSCSGTGHSQPLAAGSGSVLEAAAVLDTASHLPLGVVRFSKLQRYWTQPATCRWEWFGSRSCSGTGHSQQPASNSGKRDQQTRAASKTSKSLVFDGFQSLREGIFWPARILLLGVVRFLEPQRHRTQCRNTNSSSKLRPSFSCFYSDFRRYIRIH